MAENMPFTDWTYMYPDEQRPATSASTTSCNGLFRLRLHLCHAALLPKIRRVEIDRAARLPDHQPVLIELASSSDSAALE